MTCRSTVCARVLVGSTSRIEDVEMRYFKELRIFIPGWGEGWFINRSAVCARQVERQVSVQ